MNKKKMQHFAPMSFEGARHSVFEKFRRLFSGAFFSSSRFTVYTLCQVVFELGCRQKKKQFVAHHNVESLIMALKGHFTRIRTVNVR